jgi:hypothetical protein
MRIFTFLTTLIVLFSVIPTQLGGASAHTLKTDGDIGAVLHVDPEDDPYVGEPSGMFFEFKQKNGNFKVENCRCQVVILRDGQQIDSTTLNSPVSSFVFPERGVYTIQVSGSPLSGDSFTPFTLSWDQRVSRQRSTPGETPRWQFLGLHTPHYVGAGVLVVVFVIFLLLDKSRQKQRYSDNEKVKGSK